MCCNGEMLIGNDCRPMSHFHGRSYAVTSHNAAFEMVVELMQEQLAKLIRWKAQRLQSRHGAHAAMVRRGAHCDRPVRIGSSAQTWCKTLTAQLLLPCEETVAAAVLHSGCEATQQAASRLRPQATWALHVSHTAYNI